MIQLTQVSKTYSSGSVAAASELRALIDVNLSIDSGESVALLGPSGSGKSTLLHLMGCLDTPTSGTYLLDGVDVGCLDVNRLADIRNLKIGFVFQRFHLMPRSTALENVALPLRLAGKSVREQQLRAEELLDRVGLADRASHRPGELSGGQQQRVAIARALANKPPVLLADEPTGNLDSHSGAEIMKLLQELHRDGHTLVMVTHDERLAAKTGRLVRLLDGRIVGDARVDQNLLRATE